MRFPRLAFAALAVLAGEGRAAAQTAPEPEHEHPSPLDRPHTVAELELGIIDLPNAAISRANQGGSTFIGPIGTGDATAEVGIHLLYRATHEWAFGAGATFAPFPTYDQNYSAGTGGLSRSHTRSYLFLGGDLRYFPLRSRWVEGWLGATGGVVVIADRFTTNDAPAVPPILGTNTVTVSTEGLAVGVQAGADYLVTDQWVIGLTLRAQQWILPTQPNRSFLVFSTASCDAVGDCPTLAGSVREFEVGVTVGYRIPL